MKYDKEGTYELKYTAKDECGNTATATRNVRAIEKGVILKLTDYVVPYVPYEGVPDYTLSLESPGRNRPIKIIATDIVVVTGDTETKIDRKEVNGTTGQLNPSQPYQRFGNLDLFEDDVLDIWISAECNVKAGKAAVFWSVDDVDLEENPIPDEIRVGEFKIVRTDV